jgi:hypothetical protein
MSKKEEPAKDINYWIALAQKLHAENERLKEQLLALRGY